jgi:hypothetical protein
VHCVESAESQLVLQLVPYRVRPEDTSASDDCLLMLAHLLVVLPTGGLHGAALHAAVRHRGHAAGRPSQPQPQEQGTHRMLCGELLFVVQAASSCPEAMICVLAYLHY